MMIFIIHVFLLITVAGSFLAETQSTREVETAFTLVEPIKPTPYVSGCIEAVQGSTGEIYSPGYPNRYPSNSNCRWDLTAEESKVILIEFEFIDIEEEDDCSYDKVTVQEKDGTKFKTTAKFCGSKIPRPFKTGTNVVRIVFTSDSSENGRGFRLKWKTVATIKDCGVKYFNTSSGSLQSPGFPMLYENGLNCTYTIKAPRGHRIVIKIIEIDIENEAGCKYDALRLYETWNSGKRLLGTFCGTKLPSNEIISMGPEVTVSFISDDSGQRRGFNMSWTWRRTFIERSNETCGRKYHSSPRIVGGTIASPGEFPWQAAFFWRVGIAKGKYFCGGALINNQWVLTASHCFVNGRNASLYEVVLGNHNIRAYDINERRFSITQIIINAKYNMISYDNDIALVKLSRTVKFNDYINTLCLSSTAPMAGRRCMIAGWGATMEHSAASGILMKAEVPIVEQSTCARQDVYGSKITNNMICAGFASGGIDTCQGDSGGALHCQNETNPNVWEVQGIASWGRGCGRQLRYGVYTRVSNFVKWIECVIHHNENVSASWGMDDLHQFCERSNWKAKASSTVQFKGSLTTRLSEVSVKNSEYEAGLSEHGAGMSTMVFGEERGSESNSWIFLTSSYFLNHQSSLPTTTIGRRLQSSVYPSRIDSTLSSSLQNINFSNSVFESWMETPKTDVSSTVMVIGDGSDTAKVVAKATTRKSDREPAATETRSGISEKTSRSDWSARIITTTAMSPIDKERETSFSTPQIRTKEQLVTATAKNADTTIRTRIIPSYAIVSSIKGDSEQTRVIGRPGSLTSALQGNIDKSFLTTSFNIPTEHPYRSIIRESKNSTFYVSASVVPRAISYAALSISPTKTVQTTVLPGQESTANRLCRGNLSLTFIVVFLAVKQGLF